jgi:hypothetical protein
MADIVGRQGEPGTASKGHVYAVGWSILQPAQSYRPGFHRPDISVIFYICNFVFLDWVAILKN